MVKYNFDAIRPMAEAYNNKEAHAELKAMMNRNERITLYFTIDRYGYEAIQVESKTTQRFGYQLNSESFTWIMNYLKNGETEDFNVNPEDVVRSEEIDSYKFRKTVLLMFVENNICNIQFTPEFRDRTGKLNATANFRNGNIMFFVERDEDTISYLRERRLIR